MKLCQAEIPDVLVIEPTVFGDARGFFYESYNEEKWHELTGLDTRFVQDNHSKSVKGVLRGIHYQIKQPQGKLVRVVAGEVFDVAVDLRESSPTFGKWVGKHLSAENKQMMWVPEGFGHGFVALEDCILQYKCTSYYYPPADTGIQWNDQDLKINWPVENPVLSKKDSELPSLQSFIDNNI